MNYVNRLRNDVLLNLFGSGVKSISLIIATPFYLDILGHKEWGLVVAMMTITAITGLIGAGLNQLVPREIAKSEGGGAFTLTNFEVIYWAVSFVALLTIYNASGYVVSEWLNIGRVDVAASMLAIQLFSLQFFFQWPQSCYEGYLIGTRNFLRLNKMRIVFSVTRHFVCVFVLLLMESSVISYVLVHLIISFIETCFFRRACVSKNREINRGIRGRYTSEIFVLLGKTFKLASVVILGVSLTQIDKLAVGSLMGIEYLGYYGVVTTVGMALLQAVYPITRSVYPSLCRSMDDIDATKKLVDRGLKFVCCMVTPISVFLLLFSREVLLLWTGDPVLAESTALPLSIFTMGVYFNAIYNIHYTVMLSRENNKVPLLINLFVLVGALMAVRPMVSLWGLTGAASVWALGNCCALALGTGWLVMKKCVDLFAVRYVILHFSLYLLVLWPCGFLFDGYSGVGVGILATLTVFFLNDIKVFFNDSLSKES